MKENIVDDYIKSNDVMKKIFSENIQLNEENLKKYQKELYRHLLETICDADNPCEALDKIRNDVLTSEKCSAWFLEMLLVTEWKWLCCSDGLFFVMRRLPVSDEKTDMDTFILEKKLETRVKWFAEHVHAFGYVVAWDGEITCRGLVV